MSSVILKSIMLNVIMLNVVAPTEDHHNNVVKGSIYQSIDTCWISQWCQLFNQTTKNALENPQSRLNTIKSKKYKIVDNKLLNKR